MTLDAIIDKYGTHELDIDLVKQNNSHTIVYAYCHQHNINGQFMVNHYLEIVGKFLILKKQLENKNDICFHSAVIEKNEDGNYEIGGYGGWLVFSVDSDLQVNELSEETYYERKKTIKKDYIFPYNISDSVAKGARWDGNVLSMTFFKYYTDNNTPNEIEVNFYGVEWIRSTNVIKYPCSDDERAISSYAPNKPLSDYLLLKREWFNNNYEEFMSGNGFGLNTIRCLEDNIVFIDDRIIFSCNEIKIVKAVCTKNVAKAEKRFLKKFNRIRSDKCHLLI